jgi:hypothetical protein
MAVLHPSVEDTCADTEPCFEVVACQREVSWCWYPIPNVFRVALVSLFLIDVETSTCGCGMFSDPLPVLPLCLFSRTWTISPDFEPRMGKLRHMMWRVNLATCANVIVSPLECSDMHNTSFISVFTAHTQHLFFDMSSQIESMAASKRTRGSTPAWS